jgi:hypothetical protein
MPALSFAEFRENVGVLKPQDSREVEVQIKNMGAQRLTGVESLDPAFKVELLSQTSDGEGLLAKIRFTDVSLPKGTFLRACRFKTAQKQADFLLYGSMH